MLKYSKALNCIEYFSDFLKRAKNNYIFEECPTNIQYQNNQVKLRYISNCKVCHSSKENAIIKF